MLVRSLTAGRKNQSAPVDEPSRGEHHPQKNLDLKTRRVIGINPDSAVQCDTAIKRQALRL